MEIENKRFFRYEVDTDMEKRTPAEADWNDEKWRSRLREGKHQKIYKIYYETFGQ